MTGLRRKTAQYIRRFYLKTDPDVFEFSWHGAKTFEIRFNDRDFEVGDHLVLRETVYSGKQMRNGRPLEYTGRQIEVEVTHILFGPIYGLLEGWVIMSVKVIWFGIVGDEASQNEA